MPQWRLPMFPSKKKEDNSRILIIGDLHAPFNHKQAIDFLRAVKNKYKPTKVVQVGDEIDGQSWSFHSHSPDLPAPGDELKLAIKELQPLYSMFPNMDILESNHGSLVFRKQVDCGLPKEVIKSYRDILGAPLGWNWHDDLVLTMPNGKLLYFHHSRDSRILKTSQGLGMSSVAGHLHSLMSVEYWATPLSLNFAVQSGCLIDKKSIAFEYCKTTLKKPMLGCVVIIDSIPHIIPMVVNNENKWDGKVY